VSDPSESSEPDKTRSRLSVVLALAVVVGLCALLAWWLKPPKEPVAPEPAVHAPPDTGEPATARPPAPAPTPSQRSRRREPIPEATDDAAEPSAEAPTPTPTLRVTSDVTGAFVFLDRKFLGKTPLETRDVQAGTRRLQVSAEGYDGVSQSIEIANDGPTDVSVSLKTVVLDARVLVVHKHWFGSCGGSLIADVRGLRYVTPDREDAFSLPFGNLEKFALDY
jgi:hypothetical protein